MIKNKKSLKQYIKADRKAMLGAKSLMKEFLKGNTDDVLLFFFIKRLRKLEYLRSLYMNMGGGIIMPFVILLRNIYLCFSVGNLTCFCHRGCSVKVYV